MSRRRLDNLRATVCFAALALASGGGLPALALDPSKPLALYGIDVWQDGLPQSTVNAIVQTRDGYVWLGTYEGAVRFNGVSFTTFDRANTPEIKSNLVVELLEDREGALWA